MTEQKHILTLDQALSPTITSMTAEAHVCYFCDKSVDTYVVDAVSKKKVPICEDCFNMIYPSKKNKQLLRWWAILFPVIEEEKV